MNLTDRLRGIVKAAPAPPASVRGSGADAADACAGSLESILGGEWRGACFVVERRIDETSIHGRSRVGDIAASVDAAGDQAPMISRGAATRRPFLFFDLETTGLSGGAGTYAFLIGCGFFDGAGGFATRQYLMAAHGEERAMLGVLANELARAGTLVSFNGKSFDAPVIETRYLFHRLEWAGAHVPHLDMLHPARRFWGDVSCSLENLEARILGVRRSGDVPGFEIPSRYFQFVRSGDPRPLAAVLEHNRRDLLSLAGLTARVLQLLAHGVEEAGDAREALALGRAYAGAGFDARARAALARAVDWCSGRQGRGADLDVRIAALHALALCERRARRHDEAARRWRAILDTPGCPVHLARQASEALAIHHEHRIRDLHAARSFALDSLTAGASPAWRDAVTRRVTRIGRKLQRNAERTLLDPLAED